MESNLNHIQEWLGMTESEDWMAAWDQLKKTKVHVTLSYRDDDGDYIHLPGMKYYATSTVEKTLTPFHVAGVAQFHKEFEALFTGKASTSINLLFDTAKMEVWFPDDEDNITKIDDIVTSPGSLIGVSKCLWRPETLWQLKIENEATQNNRPIPQINVMVETDKAKAWIARR